MPAQALQGSRSFPFAFLLLARVMSGTSRANNPRNGDGLADNSTNRVLNDLACDIFT